MVNYAISYFGEPSFNSPEEGSQDQYFTDSEKHSSGHAKIGR